MVGEGRLLKVFFYSLAVNPSLSIITINFNNRDGLQKTIESVISQSYTDFEWIVIDGGSTDGSLALIEQYAKHFAYWVSEPDKGIYNAMNKGIKQSLGDYLLFLNSGDRLCDKYVVEDFLKLSFKEDIVSGNIIIDDSIYDVRFSPDEEELSYSYMCEGTILHPSSFIKRELFLKYGDYDESLKIVSDWKFFFICLIQHSCSYRKWERCISSFNTGGISESPKGMILLQSERERVKAEILPYVYRSFSDLNRTNAQLCSSISMSLGVRVGRFLQRIIRKASCVTCILYLELKRAFLGKRSRTNTQERVIVSMTSCAERLKNVPLVVDSLLQNSVKPDLIVLNLSEEEFLETGRSLSASIMNLVDKGIIDIIWTPGNLKAFKQFIPTMKKYPDDIIIAVDDGLVYPKDLIETFLKKHKQNPKSPLSGNFSCVNGVNGHCRYASLVKSDYYGNYIDELFDDQILEMNVDDIFYVFCAALNNVHYQYVGKLFYTNLRSIQAIDGLPDKGKNKTDKALIDYMINKIKDRYHIDMTKINKPLFTFV